MTTNANLYSLLRTGFASALDDPGLRVPGGVTLTYRELDDRSARMASVLGDSGLGVGDRLVAQVHKSVDNVALYLATLRRGGVYVPLNMAYTAEELSYFVDDAEPTILIHDPDTTPPSGPTSLTLSANGDGSLSEKADAAGPDGTVVHRDPDDIACMIYTSGTTGRSKGAMLSHRNLSTNAVALHQTWAFEPGDVLLHYLPIYHVHGLMVALHTAMLNGSEVIFLPSFDVPTIIAELANATVMMGVPTHYTRLLAHLLFEPGLCEGMRLFTSGSAPMSEAAHAEFTARTGHRILERYGMSEAGMITSNPYFGDRVPGTVGFALPGVEVRVCDTEGQELAPGETGTVEMRGPNLFTGYWKRPDKTKEAMRPDGFFITGDIGSLDADLRLTLEGRASDMIISGGLNVYPKEVEILLDEGDNVLESAVVGLPHSDLGEAVTAFLVPSSDTTIDTNGLAASLRDRIASFKHPKRYVIIEQLPRNTMGKVQKNALRTRHADLFEAEE